MKKNEILEKLAVLEIIIGSLSVQEKKVLNASEACAYLGITKWALYHMTSRNQIPYAKHGRSLRFIRSELDRWIQKHQVKTADDIEDAAEVYVSRNEAKNNKRK
ncbi:helix-turn-helix domain-containing protein [Pontibacter anaerobius]|uniref:Helix-turn-helix domain-containing protein n=1 Tax=Pontibacter anaerobius TaxID=2993940 RepID=A0ABT3RIH9_9BACT|nr:helix-turn-helix domain-containing protein [Pontibacter anaerobius]MCX2741469.1 helix-turn-helix domain-containing protein [Pontibacter anaerobius]